MRALFLGLLLLSAPLTHAWEIDTSQADADFRDRQHEIEEDYRASRLRDTIEDEGKRISGAIRDGADEISDSIRERPTEAFDED